MALGLSVAAMVAFGFGLAGLAAGLGNGGALRLGSFAAVAFAVVTAAGCSWCMWGQRNTLL